MCLSLYEARSFLLKSNKSYKGSDRKIWKHHFGLEIDRPLTKNDRSKFPKTILVLKLYQ